MRRSHVFERSAPRRPYVPGANRHVRLNRSDEPNAMTKALGALRTSPCIGICLLEDGVCIGCLRTIAEITAWPEMTEGQHQVIMTRFMTQLAKDRHDRDRTSKPT